MLLLLLLFTRYKLYIIIKLRYKIITIYLL